MKQLFTAFLLLFMIGSDAQVGVGTTTPNASSALDVSSTTKGLLPPRMTHAQRNAILTPAAGLIVWCKNCGTAGELQVYNGTTWTNMVGGIGSGTVPEAPTSPVATAGNAQASIAFTAPASNGGSAITGYTVTSSPGGLTATGTSSPLVVTGLTNGTAYTFTVVATNAAGNSVASSASAAVTPFTVPGAPTSPVATAGNAQASIAFTAPASNGGSAITGYTVTSSPGGLTATGTSSPLVVTGLTNGTAYTFTVVATNAAGNSVASAAAAAVTPSQSCFANVGGIVKVFMCYNLGVTGTQDPFSYQSGNNNGGLYQWGRQTDGHEERTSLTQAGPVSAPVAGKFITASTTGFDWISSPDNTLWLDASKTANDPCPAGFRVPTQAQWGGLYQDGATSGAPNSATRNTWTWTGNGFTIGSNLYLPAAGSRYGPTAAISGVGEVGCYWSSKVSGTNANSLIFNSGTVNPSGNTIRSNGISVRCISQ